MNTKRELLDALSRKVDSGEVSLEQLKHFVDSGVACTKEEAERRKHLAVLSTADDIAAFRALAGYG